MPYRPVDEKKWHADQAEDFVKSVLRADAGGRIHKPDLFRAYQAWCDETRETPLGRTSFFAALRHVVSPDQFIKSCGAHYLAGASMRETWARRVKAEAREAQP